LASLHNFRIADLDPFLISFRWISVRHVEEFVIVVESPHSSPFPQKGRCLTAGSTSLFAGFADAHGETREFDWNDDKCIENSPLNLIALANKRHKPATAASKCFVRVKFRLAHTP
jgi:hypothetical protein